MGEPPVIERVPSLPGCRCVQDECGWAPGLLDRHVLHHLPQAERGGVHREGHPAGNFFSNWSNVRVGSFGRFFPSVWTSHRCACTIQVRARTSSLHSAGSKEGGGRQEVLNEDRRA
eukprot:354390-Chlamydomonas_euryale.AAC.3